MAEPAYVTEAKRKLAKYEQIKEEAIEEGMSGSIGDRSWTSFALADLEVAIEREKAIIATWSRGGPLSFIVVDVR